MSDSIQTKEATIAGNKAESSVRLEHTLPRDGAVTKKIGYLVSQYPALSHTFIKKEVEALEAAGHEVAMVSVRKPSNLEILGEEGRRDYDRTFYLLASTVKQFVPAFFSLLCKRANIKCMVGTWFRAFKKKPLSVSTYAYFFEAVVLADWMLKNDVKHTHNHFGNAAATVAMIAAASHLVEYSMSIHGPDIFYETDTELLGMKLRGSKFSRCISHYSRSQLCLFTSGEHWPRFEIVRCGIDPEKFTPRPDPENTIPQLLCVGRLVPAKGQRVLVAASKQLHDAGVKHELTFVGTGPDTEALQVLSKEMGISEHVRFTGGMAPEGVRDEYGKADVFVLPSFAEGVPVVLMEAMASGVPVISTTITGIPELIESGKDGILVPASDCDSLSDAIATLINDKELRSSMAEKGREKVLASYNLKTNGPEMVALFDKYLQG